MGMILDHTVWSPGPWFARHLSPLPVRAGSLCRLGLPQTGRSRGQSATAAAPKGVCAVRPVPLRPSLPREAFLGPQARQGPFGHPCSPRCGVAVWLPSALQVTQAELWASPVSSPSRAGLAQEGMLRVPTAKGGETEQPRVWVSQLGAAATTSQAHVRLDRFCSARALLDAPDTVVVRALPSHLKMTLATTPKKATTA